MKIHGFTAAPPERLASALERFELQFSYPLGPGLSFRIEHGPSYLGFFQSMGEAVCFVAECDDEVRGVICVAIVPVIEPSGVCVPTAYFGDFKMRTEGAAGWTALRLLQAATAWALERSDRGIAIVMQGTPVLPTSYTGRLELPAFQELARVAILRIPAANASFQQNWFSDLETVTAHFRGQSADSYRVVNGNPFARSSFEIVPLLSPERSACGLLEDTRLAKRLFVVGGQELISAHLSCFAFDDPQSGAQLIGCALGRCREIGVPALFVAVAASRVDGLVTALDIPDITAAGAIVFGHGFLPGRDWYIHTAEI